MKITKNLIVKFWDNIRVSDAKRKAMQTPTAGLKEINDICYIDDGDKMHLLDIYFPEGTESKLPVIVDIHGGGWVYGDKELNKYFCLYLASKGFAVVNISYRLSPDYHVPDQISDIFSALHFIEKHAEGYPLDINNVFLVGDSAGGHLVSLTAAVNLSKECQRVYEVSPVSFPIRAVGCICAVTNMDMFLKYPVPVLSQYGKMMFGDDIKKSKYRQYVSFKDIIGTLKLPPFYLVSSKQDVYNFQSVHLDKVLSEHNIEHIFHNWQKGKEKALPHVFNVSFPEWEESIKTNDEMLDFFKNHSVKEEAK